MKVKHLSLSKKNQLKFINKDKTEKKQLEKRCHELWREIVFARAGYKCEYYGCHNTNQLNPHHYKTKWAYKHLRYDLENGICLCPYHHTLGGTSAHKDPNFKEIILGRYKGIPAIRTEIWATRMDLKAQSGSKPDLRLVEIYLSNELNKYITK